MDCASALEHLSERLDGALAPAEGVALDLHLADCSACREAATQFQQLDGLCRAALPQPAAVERVAAAVVRDLAATATVSRPPGNSWTGRWSVMLAAAVTMAAAVLILVLGPQRQNQLAQQADQRGPVQPVEAPKPPRFELAIQRGTVEARSTQLASWTPAAAEQPIGAALRTVADSLCEFRCPEGGVVRLDSDSEVELTAADSLTMRRGRLWCQATGDAPLRIITARNVMADNLTAMVTCAPASEMQTSITPQDSFTVYSAGGAVEVVTDGKELQLAAGQKLWFTRDMEQVQPVNDADLETAWMLPLLAERGGGDAELSRQVNGMLAKIGETKASYLFHDQLVQLGETGAIPLIEFLRSTSGSDEQVAQRINAAEIISQTAPEESIPDLVELLADPTPDVRIAAAKALERLTGLTQGVTPQDWRASGPKQTEALEKWRAWLKSTGRVPA